MTQVEVEAMSVVELKAAIYDQLSNLEGIKSNINALNTVLEKKIKEELKTIDVKGKSK